MNKMKEISLSFLLLICASCGQFEGGTIKAMQNDFDKIRIDKMLYLFNVLTEYHNKLKSFPNENDSLPVGIIFESESQSKGNDHFNTLFLDYETRVTDLNKYEKPKQAEIIDSKVFAYEIKRGINITIPNLLDPQGHPTKKPCALVVTNYKNVFDVTVFTHTAFSFSRPLGEFNNKITITSANKSLPDKGIWQFDEFIQNDELKEFMSKQLNRSGYKFLHFITKNKN